ncbi:hypothetical protein TELCIR_12639 [Teladorsagia circumcincta]|uniref:Uncharacterized protein n=1 Tax=Teladorsagia circumcincta TaxID=45464 RepID=A0A2G9U677_TELCI|nr:hypothetical protein TELCIR_12639 [Teladorsagia circumcincta]
MGKAGGGAPACNNVGARGADSVPAADNLLHWGSYDGYIFNALLFDTRSLTLKKTSHKYTDEY